MVLDVAWDLQFPLSGKLPYSSGAEISRGTCFALGAVFAIVGFTPVVAGMERPLKCAGLRKGR
jgi:hypothetical protein